MPNKNILQWAENLWSVSIGLNIAVTIFGVPYGLGWFASGMAQQSRECYDSGLFNLLIVAPLVITVASILVLILSKRSRQSGRHIEALLQSCFPVIGFTGHLIVYMLSPCH